MLGVPHRLGAPAPRGVRASEKRVARVMREEGLEVVYNRRRARGYSSYAGEVSKRRRTS